MGLITITGGAGNLGREVALILAERGYHVRLFDLPEEDFHFEAQPGMEVFQSDLRDRGALADACHGAEWVVHLAASQRGEPRTSTASTSKARDG